MDECEWSEGTLGGEARTERLKDPKGYFNLRLLNHPLMINLSISYKIPFEAIGFIGLSASHPYPTTGARTCTSTGLLFCSSEIRSGPVPPYLLASSRPA